ncbi:MAG: biotin/lipoyl-binding protein, partial [Myxococcota bacterium]|nr:biotin/lipoyl-binding protein [Myxococcota bacterium]
MGTEKKILLPDIGDFEGVDVIELLVAPGERVAVEQSLLVLESDKATMEIPSPYAGTITQLLVGVGDQVSEGTALAIIDVDGDDASTAPAEPSDSQTAPEASPASAEGARSEPQASEVHKAAPA